jgi:branched-chain amino acid transport system ATP-binding protein
MLRLEGVRASYGPIEALRGLDLDVRAGELVCLLGANGAGKSSTLRTISGLLRPRAGRIVFDGAEIQGRDPSEVLRAGIAHCPEGRRVFPYLTVKENLAMGAYVRRDGAAITADLARVYAHFPILAERRRQAAGTLSGGEQQMLAIGRALMARPRLLLLDEPSMGLAPVLVEQIFETVLTINKQGVTILLVEQNAAMALSIAGRGYVLETGGIVLEGTARDLADNPEVRRAYLGET